MIRGIFSRRPDNSQFLADGAGTAEEKALFIGIIKDIPFHKVIKVLPLPYLITFGTGLLRNHQLPGLVGARDHFLPILGQPFFNSPLPVAHTALLLKMGSPLRFSPMPDPAFSFLPNLERSARLQSFSILYPYAESSLYRIIRNPLP